MAWNAGFGIELSILIKCARMPTVVILVGSDFLLLLLLCPFRTCWHQEGINVLLGDQVCALATFPEGTQPQVQDGLPHSLRVHLEQLGSFFHGVVLHVLTVFVDWGWQVQASPLVGLLLCQFTGTWQQRDHKDMAHFLN